MKDDAAKELDWSFLGRVPFQEMWDRQEKHRDAMLNEGKPPHLYLVEHPPTITLGRGENGSNLLFNRKALLDKGYDVVDINRGGKVTYHGPGQLVAYPIVNLRHFGPGVKKFICGLENVVLQILEKLDLQGFREPGFPGVWVEGKKIASVGIHVRRQISIHGVAMNVTTDLSRFSAITPCGISQVKMTSLCDQGIKLGLEEAASLFGQMFLKVLGCNFVSRDNKANTVTPLHTISASRDEYVY